jgi:hypothetical protein
MAMTTPAAGGPRGPAGANGADTGAPLATGTGTTTGAVTVTLITQLVPANSVVYYRVRFAAQTTTGTGEAYGREIALRRGASGAATIISGAAGVLTVEDNAAATVTFSVDGSGNVLVQFLGVTGITHNVKAKLYQEVEYP